MTVSTPWRPVSGHHYPEIEIHMADDFTRSRDTNAIVECINVTGTTFDRLKIVGDVGWKPRFEWMTIGSDPKPFEQAIGGVGSSDALAGVELINSNVTFRRLEVFGVPGPGVHSGTNSTFQIIESGIMDRVGWPIMVRTWSSPFNIVVNNLTSRNHWYSNNWDLLITGNPIASGQGPPLALRPLQDANISQRGELVGHGPGFTLNGYVHTGDGIGWKMQGGTPGLRITGGHSGHGYLTGRTDSLWESLGDRYSIEARPYLYQSHDIEVSDHVFCDGGSVHPYRRMFIAGVFDTPAVIRRCVFERRCHYPPDISGYPTCPDGLLTDAIQFHSGGRAILDDCTFIGFRNETNTTDGNAFSVVADGSEGPTVLGNCRFYDS